MRFRSLFGWLLRLALIRNGVAIFAKLLNRLKTLNSRLCTSCQPALTVWRRLPEFWQRFTSNFVVGCVIALVLSAAHHSSWVVEAENMAMDAMMSLNQALPRMGTPNTHLNPIAFTFLDIDENSYREWDEPFHIPRDKLAQLIKFAAEGQAKAIIVDVDLSKSSDNDGALINLVNNYQADLPPLLLLRTFYPASTKTQETKYQLRPTIFDDTQVSPQVYWVHPLFKQSKYDGSARYWQLFKIACFNHQPLVIPSIQLMLDGILRTGIPKQELQNTFNSLAPNSCTEIEQIERNLSGELHYGDRTLQLKPDRIGERIIYTLPWKRATGDELIAIPAWRVTESDREQSHDLIRDRIVVIGASFSDSRDIYHTPLEAMPGALIIMNAIKSIYNYGQITLPPSWVKWSTVLSLIVLTSWAFARFNSFQGTLIIGSVIVITLIPMSFYFFKYGLWVDFAVPLLGMQFQQLIADYKEGLVKKTSAQHNESQTGEPHET